MKISRNDPCHCGSEKKYKKCCYDNDRKNRIIPREAIEALLEKQKRLDKQKKLLEEKGIYINYVNPILFKDKKVWALGNKAYHSRPENETFHEFIIDILRITLGKEWWDAQTASPQKHFLYECYLNYNKWRQKNAINSNRVNEKMWGGKADGSTKSLLSLAFDVCSLMHRSDLPDSLLNRLRSFDGYQGARYEIEIAAIVARLDCEIDLLDERETSKKHCEFVAKHRNTGIEFAVEAKSRHRKGVIHQAGKESELKLLKGDVGKLINEALKQNPGDKPFIIFIDVNTPFQQKENFFDKQWVKDVQKFINKFDTPTLETPDDYNAIIFTNHSYHYQLESDVLPGEHLFSIPQYAKQQLPFNFLMMLQNALNNNGFVPNIDFIE